jgi:hypothetical protein
MKCMQKMEKRHIRLKGYNENLFRSNNNEEQKKIPYIIFVQVVKLSEEDLHICHSADFHVKLCLVVEMR